MKLLSFQPFSIYGEGGGSRILRRLYEGHEKEIVSLVVTIYKTKQVKNVIQEKTVNTYPQLKPWMRSFLRTFCFWLIRSVFKFKTEQRIRKYASSISFDILHVVNHLYFSDALCDDCIISGKKLWVSFHDHFLPAGSSFKTAKLLWQRSDRRFVISLEMGQHYDELFGMRNYEIITDGICKADITLPSIKENSPLIIYFAGALHLDYYPLFESLANAMDLLSKNGYSFKLLLRGTQKLSFLSDRNFSLQYQPFSLNENDLKEELDTADILYLPMRFTTPEFSLYSLSTKMVGYLGSSGTILYHGPSDSAAYNLLMAYDAAIFCISLDVDDLVKTILKMGDKNYSYSMNAKKLAKEKFLLSAIRERFWEHDK